MLKNWLCCPFSSWNMSSVDFLLHLLMVELLSLCGSHRASWLLPCFPARKLEKEGWGAPGVASGCCMVMVAAEQLQETEHVKCGLRAVVHPGVGLAAPRAIGAEGRDSNPQEPQGLHTLPLSKVCLLWKATGQRSSQRSSLAWEQAFLKSHR